MLADIWESIPGIIKEAATSPLGIFALMIIALAILAFFFFKDSGVTVKVVIFILLFLGVAVFAGKVVYKVNQVAASAGSPTRMPMSDSQSPVAQATPIPLPADTGWVFAGYFDIDKEMFVEGPYVEVVTTPRREKKRYVEIGDVIRLKVSRPIVIVGYKKTYTSRALNSPEEAGVIGVDDQTGVVLPKGTELIVRDVREGHNLNNPIAALWLRIVHIPK